MSSNHSKRKPKAEKFRGAFEILSGEADYKREQLKDLENKIGDFRAKLERDEDNLKKGKRRLKSIEEVLEVISEPIIEEAPE